MNKNSLDNLKPFEKGESGNPNGRPLGQKNYATLYREALLKLADLNGKEPDDLELEMISKAITEARKGNYKFYQDILDRLYGKPKQSHDVTTAGLPIVEISKEIAEKYNVITHSPIDNSEGQTQI